MDFPENCYESEARGKTENQILKMSQGKDTNDLSANGKNLKQKEIILNQLTNKEVVQTIRIKR